MLRGPYTIFCFSPDFSVLFCVKGWEESGVNNIRLVQTGKKNKKSWCILFAYFICNCGIINLSHIWSIWHGKHVVTQQ